MSWYVHGLEDQYLARSKVQVGRSVIHDHFFHVKIGA